MQAALGAQGKNKQKNHHFFKKAKQNFYYCYFQEALTTTTTTTQTQAVILHSLPRFQPPFANSSAFNQRPQRSLSLDSPANSVTSRQSANSQH